MGGPPKMCETCGKKRACYGLTDSGKRQWCADCAKDQPGETELIGAKMCEGCGKKRPHYGLTDMGKPQWCADCAKDQEGETERIDKNKLCEGCGKKRANCLYIYVRRPCTYICKAQGTLPSQA